MLTLIADTVGRSGSTQRSAHLVPLTREWALWRDFAVRSAGFPVDGLDAFGEGDEHARLGGVARDAAFREAVTWQSREALASAVQKLADEVGGSPAAQRRREEVVASYWQRYCAKNDTIGFFGPLAWGQIAQDGPAIALQAGELVHERVVHLEVWAVEAIARAAGFEIALPMGPHPERELRVRLAREPDSRVRKRGLAALERIEAARAALAEAGRVGVLDAMNALDRVFEELTGRRAERGEHDAGGGRTVAYLDCMRDLDVTLGPGVLAELRATLPAVLASSRWWCGIANAAAQDRLERIATAQGPGPLAPMMSELMGAAWGLFEQLDVEAAELQRRWAVLLNAGEDATIAERATTAFADHRPAWPLSAYQSADLQIAAADTAAINRGEFGIVLGDLHGGSNPLVQGIFARRHPEPDAFHARIGADVGPQVMLLPPRAGIVPMTARNFPVLGGPNDVHVVPGAFDVAPEQGRTVSIQELTVADGHVSDPEGSFRIPLAELLWLPIFISAIRSFDPFGARDGERVTIGRTVVQRARWQAPAAELPDEPNALAAWARDRGLPRRLFARSPLDRKPIYIDLDSPVLLRVLTRFIRPARERAPRAPITLTEMLPNPDECWLRDSAGRYTSELRVVALDTTRRPGREDRHDNDAADASSVGAIGRGETRC